MKKDAEDGDRTSRDNRIEARSAVAGVSRTQPETRVESRCELEAVTIAARLESAKARAKPRSSDEIRAGSPRVIVARLSDLFHAHRAHLNGPGRLRAMPSRPRVVQVVRAFASARAPPPLLPSLSRAFSSPASARSLIPMVVSREVSSVAPFNAPHHPLTPPPARPVNRRARVRPLFEAAEGEDCVSKWSGMPCRAFGGS